MIPPKSFLLPIIPMAALFWSPSLMISREFRIRSHKLFTSPPDRESGFQSEAVSTRFRAVSTVCFIVGLFTIHPSQKARIEGSSGNRTHRIKSFSIASSSAEYSEYGFIESIMLLQKGVYAWMARKRRLSQGSYVSGTQSAIHKGKQSGVILYSTFSDKTGSPPPLIP